MANNSLQYNGVHHKQIIINEQIFSVQNNQS